MAGLVKKIEELMKVELGKMRHLHDQGMITFEYLEVGRIIYEDTHGLQHSYMCASYVVYLRMCTHTQVHNIRGV